MIVFQGGLVEVFLGVFVLLAVALAVIYFLVLPGYVFWKETKTWRAKRKSVCVISYIILLSLSTFIFWVLPDYLQQNFHVDIIGKSYHQLSMYVFFTLPLAYIVTIGAVRIITQKKK